MKKVLLGVSFCMFLAAGFTACTKAGCYTCKNVTLEVSVCDDNVTGAGLVNETAATQIKALSSGSTNDDYKAAAETLGYTCN